VEPLLTGAGGAVVSRTITAPGRDRQVVLLAPGARGGTAVLTLERRPDLLAGSGPATTPVLTIDLIRAPWEDDGLG
jgi:hypothetical protein